MLLVVGFFGVACLQRRRCFQPEGWKMPFGCCLISLGVDVAVVVVGWQGPSVPFLLLLDLFDC